MPPKPFRVVRLGVKSGRSVSATKTSPVPPSSSSSSPSSILSASPASRAKMGLLTYKMALAQPTATVPLLASTLQQRSHAAPAVAGADGARREAGHALDINRRWVRDADELCVASIRRSNNINKINTYVATYKFDDPHWRPFLLPEVHLMPAAAARDTAGSHSSSPPDRSPPTSSSAPPPPAFDVFIDYDKQINIELISRHANFALRHLVQKGHAMYFVNYSQHSILEMRGLVEASYITCAYGIKGERLRTHMLHIGPLDVRDVMELDSLTGRVTFNLSKKGVRKGVVAVSLVEGYGTWFQRKPMLWQRTRRIGALQSQMGAFDFQLCPCETVGKHADHAVSLLEPHLRLMGAGGGAEAVGIIASSQIAQNDRLYMGQFEAPVITALDAVHQLVHRVALHNKLVRPATAQTEQGEEEEEEGTGEAGRLRALLAMEKMLPVAWVTRTPPPYVPLEADLPFRLQLSKPAVFHAEGRGTAASTTPSASSPPASVVYPTGGTVGSPMVTGVPLSLYEYNLHQGVDHYIYDDAPSARPTKWWSQKSNMPYNGYLYCMRSGLLDYVVPAEAFTNPLAPPSPAAHRRSSSLSQRWKRRQRRASRRLAKHKDKDEQKPDHAEHPGDDAGDALEEEEQVAVAVVAPTVEQWRRGQTDLDGHDADALAAEEALLAQEELDRYVLQRRPSLADIVPPSEMAAERAARYERNLLGNTGTHVGNAPGNEEKTVRDGAKRSQAAARGPSPSEALLQRQLRQRALQRKTRRTKKNKSKKGPSAGGAEGDKA